MPGSRKWPWSPKCPSPAGVSQNIMRFSLVISFLFHGLVVIMTTYGLPWVMMPPMVMPDVIPVQLVRLDEKTTPPKPKPAPKPKKRKFPPQAVAQPAPSTDPDAVPLPSVKPKPKKQRLASAAPRPRMRPRPPSRHKFDRTKIAALLNKRLSEKAPDVPPEKAPEVQTVKAEPALDLPLTISERDALRARLAECWTLPAHPGQNLYIHSIHDIQQDLVLPVR